MAISISVIVPVYEQWNLVPLLLRCFEQQNFPRDQFEVIFADNGSTNFAPPPLPDNARIVHCAQPGSYAARNAAAKLATGEWFAFTDADCLPEPGWLDALVAAAVDDRTILVGAVEMRAASERPNAYEVYDIVKGIPQERYARRGYGATANLAVAAGLFRELGGFDATRLSGGDAEFCRRAGAAGATVRYVAAAKVGHPARATWEELKTKARRVKGGQLARGSVGRRAAWVVRTIAPPLLDWMRIMRSEQPWSRRSVALVVQARLWLVELAETPRLLAGGSPERR